MRNIAVSFALIIAIYFVALPAFADGPWKGRIIDIETKEPLEGVVIVAVWERAWRTAAGAVSDVYKVKEVVTGKDGEFEMTSYTPINLLPLLTYMKDPEFIIYKPGYAKLEMAVGDYLTGSMERAPYSAEILGFRISPGMVELRKLKTKEDRLNTTPSGPGDTSLKDLPLLYKAINEERRHFGLGAVTK